MRVQALTSTDPHQLFNLRSISGGEAHRLDSRIRSASISNDFSGRLTVMTAEGDTITLAADLETDFRSGSHACCVESDHATGNIGVQYTHSAIRQNFGIAVDGDLNNEERQDLEVLFQKISSIFHGFLHRQDEDARAYTAKLAEGFGVLDSLSSLDLSVEAVRSVAVATASRVTPGGAPATVAAIPQPSNGTTAPTPSSDSPDGAHLNVPVKDAQLASLMRQVLDALKESKIESEKVRKHLPDFFETLYENLVKELRGQRELKSENQDHSQLHVSHDVDISTASSSLLIAYRALIETSSSLSIQG